MIVLDTDHISALRYRDGPKAFTLQSRLDSLSLDEIATTAITIEEQMRGWLGLIRRYTDMQTKVSATELARRLGAILGKVRYRRDVFVVERNGEAVAKLSPLPSHSDTTLRGAFNAWVETEPNDDRFADDLERVNRADRPPTNPWA